ncbi:MAG: hypothetical protein ACK4R3_08780 [Aliihoeflea sp.]
MATLRILDSITDRGDPKRPNEDASGGNRTAAFVIDGATGLGENLLPDASSDAAWLAALAKDCFEELADGKRSIGDVVRRTNARAKAVLDGILYGGDLPAWQLPVAGFQMISVANGSISTHGLGDCRLFLLAGDGKALDRTALAGRGEETDGARRAISASGGLTQASDLLARPEVRAALRERRARYNREGTDVWTLGTEPKAARHVVSEELEIALPARGLLCTDGFAALVDAYGRYDAATLVDTASRAGLSKLLAELRVVEHREDPEGSAFPRFKRSDDATALLFEIV